jgi:hypothetical protein
MSDSEQNEHKKATVNQESANSNNSGAQYSGVSKAHKEEHQKATKSDLNAQETGDENICPDDKSDIEPESGSLCEFQ